MTSVMQHIDMWRMAVDVALVTAILVMAFRYMKGSAAQALLPKTIELEGSLRSLISEADAAGRHLNDQLLRREQNLQRLLGDIEGAEQRMTRAIAAAEERSSSLGNDCNKAKSVLDEVARTMSELRVELMRESEVSAAPRTRMDTSAPSARQATYREPAPVEFQDVAPAARTVAPQQTARQFQAQPAAENRQMSTFPALGLLGDVAPSRRQNEEVMAAPTARDTTARMTDSMGHAEMKAVYATAENLLKEGQRVEQVSAQTRIPVEELRMLSQMIEIEREEEAKQGSKPRVSIQTDPRLGALGAVRRPAQSV